MFSIGDIQSEEEPEFSEGAESEGEEANEPLHVYPIRASLSVTKVRSMEGVLCTVSDWNIRQMGLGH
jgi:hypothetical protein